MMAAIAEHYSKSTSTAGTLEYGRAPVEQTRALSLRAEYLRTDVDNLSQEVREVQADVRGQHLYDRTAQKARNNVAGLLDELTTVRGMSWTDVAEVAGVSVSAVRKWRKGGDASPASRKKLAEISALLDVLEEKGTIKDPAAWMEMDLPLGPGHFIRPLDLYLEGHLDALMELVEERKSATVVLDEVRPQWRESRSDFEVFSDVDGERSIRMRRA